MNIELLRFDMSEYMERHTVSRLIGAPPGYVGYDEGGLLTEAVMKHPHAVILLDEIEKAHPDVFNLLLQVMDHGSLTDTNGRKVDFRNVILIMTSNAGAEAMGRSSMGFTTQDHSSDGMETVKKTFTPEFRNRLDAIIQFKPLDRKTIVHVVDKFIVQLEAQLEEKKVMLHVDESAREWLAQKGYDEKMGARPMTRVIQEHIKKPLAEEVLFGHLANGGDVHIFARNGEIELEFEEELVES
jgi:ATP-dependent Clp protease ATP-binding subunit ClpA